LEFPKKINLSNNAIDLIKKMINYPYCRLGKNGVDEIKKHPFFNDIDWDNLHNMKPPFIPNLSCDNDVKYFEKFPMKESFYPENKSRKRNDIEYIEYTYRTSENEEKNLEEEYQNAIKDVEFIQKNDSLERLDTNSTGTGSRNLSYNNLKKINLIKLPSDNKSDKEKNDDCNKKINYIPLPKKKKIKIDCNNNIKNKSPWNSFKSESPNQTIVKQNSIKSLTHRNKIRISPSPNKNLLIKNFTKNIPLLKVNNTLGKNKNNSIQLLKSRLKGNCTIVKENQLITE
jgi:hypothetical protein